MNARVFSAWCAVLLCLVGMRAEALEAGLFPADELAPRAAPPRPGG